MYKLSESLPYLLNRLGVRMGGLFSQRLEPYGLSLPMYRVLASLLEQPGQRLGDLANVTSVELSTMSRMIGSMVRMGLVTRQRLPNNERTVSINLTSKGHQLGTELALEAKHYEDVAINMLAPEDIQKLKQLLVTVYASIDQLESELIDGTS